jgi:flagellar hook-basal body complex protein FliE
MPGPILPISVPVMPELAGTGAASPGGGGFADVLSHAIQTVGGLDRQASESVQRFLSGDGEDLHTAVLATTRAELAFDMLLQTRNKVVSAYQEIMRMQM